jgi:hypothetical protein
MTDLASKRTAEHLLALNMTDEVIEAATGLGLMEIIALRAVRAACGFGIRDAVLDKEAPEQQR